MSVACFQIMCFDRLQVLTEWLLADSDPNTSYICDDNIFTWHNEYVCLGKSPLSFDVLVTFLCSDRLRSNEPKQI